MAKLLFLIGILLLVSCAPAAPTEASPPTLPATSAAPAGQISTPTPIPEVPVGVVEVDLLNIREGPGTNYPILSSLAKGEKFYILGEVVNNTSNKWLLVSSSTDSLGWVIGDQTYVTMQSETVDLNTYLTWQKNKETAQSLLIALTATP